MKRLHFLVGWIFLLFWAFSNTNVDSDPIRPISGDQDLIAHWPMDEMQGQTIVDHSSSNNNADLGWLGWGDDGGVFFKGVDDQHIRIPFIEGYDFSKYGQFTVLAWAKPYSNQGWPAIVRIGREAVSERTIIDINGGNWRFVVRDQNGGSSCRIHGAIKDVRIYKRALDDGEIRAIIIETKTNQILTKNMR